jgi:hypothetical protein
MRWEYGSPITERYGRLVNLDLTPGFAAAAPVVGNNPVGLLTGQKYPGSLIRPDKHGFEPRVAFAWHPLAGSSTVVRGGYGVYYNTSVYQTIATMMAQQSPLSKSLSVHSGERLQRESGKRSEHIRHRSELPRGLCAKLAVIGAKGPD